ncbi:MAG: glycoside hydrolase family 2 TIM barrel-domain containing protein [Candidatus Latescibacter sp.]|nr:glycoside hydrolase family 2 TIM barrel-domain containing protein [Candidatus Latescibacter sp.]
MARTYLNRSVLFSLLVFTLFTGAASGTPGSVVMDLSGDKWRLWLDKKADWMNDSLFMPPVDMSKVPVNPPTCGWDLLSLKGDKASVPGTVEEYRWADNGNPVGNAGDYRGVSWWSTTFTLDPTLSGKIITLKFDSVVLRAEVFVNRKLMGYDVIGNSPFALDITGAVNFGGQNRLDVRITDPVGNFDWSNNDWYPWGKNRVPATHGFGGITGKVTLRAADAVSIDDLYMQNKPKFTDVEAFVTLNNSTGREQIGQINLEIREWQDPYSVVWQKTVPATVPAGGAVVSLPASVPNAKLWYHRDPHLYVAKATFTSADKQIADSEEQRFGFRWFSINKVDGDEMFFMNDRRIFILSPMNRGFWPKNGMFPTPDMLKKNMNLLREMGFNMCLMNQAIGRPELIEACDEIGMVSYEEIGGYRCNDDPDEQAMVWRREKARRMAMRDRSQPSLIIYVMKCETRVPPSDDDKNNMKMIHEIDPVRLITYNSDCDPRKRSVLNDASDPFKMHMRPGETELKYYGWWNQHHWVPFAGYLDQYYKNPQFYLRGTLVETNTDSLPQLNKDEILYLGEEGDFSSMARLQKIREELDKTGATGWREQEHIDWYNEYDRFLDRSGFRKFFPTVDDLTLALGVNVFYYHGRLIENCRTGNKIDGININSWAAGSDRTDMVDMYRNPVADPAIFAHYTQPLYVAVKIRSKVHPLGDTAIADLFIVNEKDLKGKHTLEAKLYDPEGVVIFAKNYEVNIIGGARFGQLLVEGVQLPVFSKPGYYNLKARILKGDEVKADGFDDIFVVDYMNGPGLHGRWAVIDSSGAINTFLKKTRGIALPEFKATGPGDYYDYIVLGPHAEGRNLNTQIMNMVTNGATLFVFSGAEAWAQTLGRNAINFSGISTQRGSRFFVGENRFMQGLPKSQAMNWEYQEFYHTRSMTGIFMDHLGAELIVGCASPSSKNITAALTRIPYANGQIFLSTLDFMGKLSLTIPQAAVTKKLFLNLLEYARDGIE